jgi:spoIIIJ-associated protein
MRSKDRGISTAYFEAVAPTYDEAKALALKGIRLQEREVCIKEGGVSSEGVVVRAVSSRTRVQEAILDLKLFLDGMNVDAEIDGREEAGLIFINVEGPMLGFLIGRRGSSLEALEYLLNIIHRRRFTLQRHIIIDIGGYRVRGMEYIEGLLLRAVQHIANRGTPYRLHPMPPKDRKLAHLLLRKHPGHVSKSVGEGEDRYMEIHPAPESDEAIAAEDEIIEAEKEDTGSPVPLMREEWENDDEGSLLD